jgi:hypothetical protein
MTLLVFLGIVVSLLILRLIPGLLLRLVLAIPRHHFVALMRQVHSRKISIALSRTAATPRSRVKLVLVSSSLLALALLATTAFWSWHSASLMMLLR